MEMIDVDGVRVAYERVGDGPPLVLLHGYVGDGPTTWRGVGDDTHDDTAPVETCGRGRRPCAPPTRTSPPHAGAGIYPTRQRRRALWLLAWSPRLPSGDR